MKDLSLEMLEFPKVRELLAGYTSFAVSRELALSLTPSADAEQVAQWLRLSAEARHLLSLEPDFSIGGVYDIREPVALAARGKILELKTLVDIQNTLTAIRLLRSRLNRLVSEVPLLAAIGNQLVPLPELEKEIGRCVTPGAELMDSASDRLAELRQLIKEKRHQILTRLDAIIKSQDNERLIQEPLITEREGRYVIPVKIELRREIKGIVHDISNTGATAFVEPMPVVDLGNELRELVIEEQHEVERILIELSARIGSHESSIIQNLKLEAEIDLALAKARYAEKAGAFEPVLADLKNDSRKQANEGRILRLINARHPLLKGKPVPLSVEIGKDFLGLVITGPNTGGKTVALKTIGLLSLMTQAGIPIPAAPESCLPVFDHIYADIGDEQSIEQTLSTFSWHMGNIVRILKEATERSLVLLDELGTSTDPGEGAALAQEILLQFLKRGSMIVATTHFTELKSFAHTTRGLQNASLDFDPVTFRPTYHLTQGIPGGSNALAIAAQLGLPEEIIAGAKQRLSKSSQEIETLLADLMAEKQKIRAMQESIEKERIEAEKLRRELEEEKQKLKEKEYHLVREIREKLVREGDELLREIRDAMAELKKSRSQEKIELARKAFAEIREKLKGSTWHPETATGDVKSDFTLEIGDRVWIKDLNVQGTVISPQDGNGLLEIQIGNTRVRMAAESLDKASKSSGESVRITSVRSSFPRKVVSRELDLRGKRADEVEPELDAYLNDASLSSLSEVRIIHGQGTGTVKQIVRRFLASHPLVNSFRSGKKEEGGDGVTVVKL